MRKELITLLAVVLFTPQVEAANAIGNNAIAIGREVTAGKGTDDKGQIVIGNRNQSDVWIGGWNIAEIAKATDVDPWSPPPPSPPRIPDPRRPAIQSGISDASAGVRGAESRAESPVVVPVATAQCGGVAATTLCGTGSIGNTVLGTSAQTTASNGTAIGHQARAEGRGGTAIGAGANIVGAYGTAIGFNSEADNDGVAMGRNAEAGVMGIAIGKDVTAPGRQIAVGNSVHENVRIGRYDVRAMNADIARHETEIGNLRNDISNFQSDLGKSRSEYRKGIAMAMAQEFISVDRDRRARFGMTSSAYRGEFGIGASAGVRLNDKIQLHFSGAMDAGFDEKAIKAGFDIQFGGKP